MSVVDSLYLCLSELFPIQYNIIIIIHSLELFTSALADIIIIYSLKSFISALADSFLLESVLQQVSSSLQNFLSILAVLNNVVIWMVSTRPPTSKSSRSFSNPLATVPNTPITIGIIVTSMFHTLFNSLASSRNLSFFSHSFSFYYYYYYYYYYLLLESFSHRFCWWFLSGVGVTANLLESPGLLSVYWPFSVMLSFG